MNSESSSYWQPLGFASMAAVLRENDLKVDILDCLPLKIGWNSLEKEIIMKKPDIVCVGDETASYYEAAKAIELVKKIDKDIICVAGGYHFGNTILRSFEETKVDFIVKGEGEITLLELVKAIDRGNGFEKIKGIAYKNKRVKINQDRELIKDLDTLPFPAYDLLPMHIYGNKSTNHKD